MVWKALLGYFMLQSQSKEPSPVPRGSIRKGSKCSYPLGGRWRHGQVRWLFKDVVVQPGLRALQWHCMEM